MEAILNNMKRFDNLYSTNKNVSMLKTFDVSYKLFYYGRLVNVIFTPKGWHIVNL